VGAVRCCPGLVAVPVQTVDSNYAGDCQYVLLQCDGWLYSTTGCSPSATTLKPWADASDGSCGFDELPACYSVSLTEAEYWVDKYRVLPEWVQSPPFRCLHGSSGGFNYPQA
jgi:hypothetical protein